MRNLILVLLIGLVSAVAHGADRPDWAFPVADKVQPPTKKDDQPKTLAGSALSYTQKQIDDLKNPPDWFPDMHPPMTRVHRLRSFHQLRVRRICRAMRR